jgi:hypothetical protein
MVSSEIPEYLQKLSDRLVAEKLLELMPDSVSVNEYLKGQAIEPHVDDKTSGRVITVLSLMAPATMVFARAAQTFALELPPRSIVKMCGEGRDLWTHAIPPVSAHRYSIVFRCTHDI